MRKAMLLLAVFGLAGFLYSADNPFIGTWKINVAKSKGTDLPKSETVKTVAQGNELKTTIDTVDAQGKAIHTDWVGKWDGKDYPVKGDPDADMSATTKIDANTISVVNKKAGKEVVTYRVTISKDGKNSTVVGTAKDAKGQEMKFNLVYDKQ